jgi:hypothetical protein
MDFTTTNLEAAILDQKVAGTFPGKRYAFHYVARKGSWRLGVAVKDEPGYHPIDGLQFDSLHIAKRWANGLNEHIGLTRDAALDIVASTMRKGNWQWDG